MGKIQIPLTLRRCILTGLINELIVVYQEEYTHQSEVTRKSQIALLEGVSIIQTRNQETSGKVRFGGLNGRIHASASIPSWLAAIMSRH
jgi:hypothetical protein